ncbi:MAG: tRNA 5-methoxyuridine(34)/uridine 5-oxyacetic acid(34) synthase CmoB [Desulforhopalus sp.]|nr:tRNA 5-methoxyuridine(34)/uridine 5-oxyacetic acid(34) synthase CmoB [Desulforhopalus sp.]
MHYIDRLPATADHTSIITEHKRKQAWVNQEKKGFLRYRTPCQALAQWKAHNCDFSADTVSIGTGDEISSREKILIRENLKAFMPWRKGPFSVFGNDIDAEWRSNLKWNQLREELPELENKIIADVGCNNGYYMFRMAARKPRFVLGLEPSVQHYYCFKALNAMAGCSNLDIDLLGVEHLKYFVECFDVVFLMGIIYHRPSPVDTLRDILTSLQPGGTMILETQAIPGKTPVALFPDGTYAKVPGTYFVPTASCLINWVRKAGFKNIKLFASHAMTPDIQRRTEWMIYESLSDYLDPADPTRTVEGYPAPLRVFLKAEK